MAIKPKKSTNARGKKQQGKQLAGTQYYESVRSQFEQVLSRRTLHLSDNALEMVEYYRDNNPRLADMKMLATALQTYSGGRKIAAIPSLPFRRGKDAGSRRRGPKAAGTGNRVRYPYVMQIGNKRRPVSEETFSIYQTLQEHGTLPSHVFRRQLKEWRSLDNIIDGMIGRNEIDEDRRVRVRTPGNVLNRLYAMLAADPELAPEAYDDLMIVRYHPGFATSEQARNVWNCALQIVPERTSSILPESCDIMYAAKMCAAKNSIPELADIAALVNIEFGAARWYAKLSRPIPAYEKKTLYERLSESNSMTPAEAAGARYALGQERYGEKREAAGRALVEKYLGEQPVERIRTAMKVYERDKERIAESKGKPDNAVLALSKQQYAALNKFFTTFDTDRFMLLQPHRKEAVGLWISSRFFLEEMVRYLPKVADVAAIYGDGVREKDDIDKKIAYLRTLETTGAGVFGPVLWMYDARIQCGKRKRPFSIGALAEKPFLRKEEAAAINNIYNAAQSMFGLTNENAPARLSSLAQQTKELSAIEGRVFYALSEIRVLPCEASDLFRREKNIRIAGGIEMIDPGKVQENYERVLHPGSYTGKKRVYVTVSSVEGFVAAVWWLYNHGKHPEMSDLADAVRRNPDCTYVDKRLADQIRREYDRLQGIGEGTR